MGEPVCSSDRYLCYWPRICAQSKNQDGEEHSVAYRSRKLLPREQKYLAIEKEALTIVSGIKHYRTYLEGTEFQVETDHDPLSRLSNLKDSHERLAGWALTMQPYCFTIVHRSGTANADADGLSRDQGSRIKEEGVSRKTLTVKIQVLVVCRTISYICIFSVHDLVYSYLVHRIDNSLCSYQVT